MRSLLFINLLVILNMYLLVLSYDVQRRKEVRSPGWFGVSWCRVWEYGLHF